MFKLCSNSMDFTASSKLSKSIFSKKKKEEVGSCDNIALNQRCIQLEALVLSKIIVDGCFGKTTLALQNVNKTRIAQ